MNETARPKVAIVDYGSGNLPSAARAFAVAGADVTVTRDVGSVVDADGVVVPGVGAFAACVAGLRAAGADTMLAHRIANNAPIFGICVGLQAFFTSGDEHGEVTAGLGFLPGTVTKLAANRLPHMGWNTVTAPADSVLFAGVRPDTRFYFVHSYAARTSPGRVTYGDYGGRFVAAVEHGPITGTQFHPEKSGDAGAAILANWVRSLRSNDAAHAAASR